MQSSARKAATIRGGTYSVASGMSFTGSDNGETWIAYPGEVPVLDGGGQGTLRLGNSSRMTFQGLTFRNMGADGVFIDYGDAFTIQSNVFTNCRLGCITANFLTNSVLDSNTIDGQSPGNPAGNTGNAYSAIHLYGTSSNNRITRNLIKNTQGGGIGLDNGPTQAGCSNNIIDRNLLQNVDTNVVDFGAIYIYDPSHAGVGNQITNNVVDQYGGPNGVANAVKGIYLDDLTSNVLVSGNIVRNGGAWAFMIHGGDRNTITNNVWDLSSSGTQLAFYQSSPFGSYGMSSNVFTKNLVYSASTYPSSLYLIYKGSGDASLAASNNLYYSATGAAIPNSGFVDSNRILSNPLFASPSTANYAMPPSSPAYTTVGFAPLPTDQGPLQR
jgi:parallel beta-helix repeat protein